MESPRATGPPRRPSPPVLKRPRLTLPRWPASAQHAAVGAGFVLALTGRADLWTLALAFGVADRSLLTAFVVAAAGVATLARVGSAALVDISGAQAVLGAAGFTGSLAAVAATWASALALIAVARDRLTGAGLGLLAGILVAGPALAGGVRAAGVWLLGAAVGASVGWMLRPAPQRRRWHVLVDVGAASVAIALGVVAGYH